MATPTKPVVAPELGFSLEIPTSRQLTQLGDPFAELQKEINLAPQLSSILPSGEIILGVPKPFNLYGAYTGIIEGTDDGEPYSLKSTPKSLSTIAKHVVEQEHGLVGQYPILRQTMTDAEILQRLTYDPQTQDLYRLPTEEVAFAEGLAREGLKTAAMIGTPLALGATTLPGVIATSLLGLAGATGLEGILFPEQRLMPQLRDEFLSGQFTGAAAGFAAIPGVTTSGATARAFESLPAQINAPYLNSAYQVFRRGVPALLDTAAENVRRNPMTSAAAEATGISAGAFLGQQYGEELQQVDPSFGRAGIEGLSAVFNPFLIFNIGELGTRGFEFARSRLTRGGQEAVIADALIKEFTDLGVDPSDALSFIEKPSEFSRLAKELGFEIPNEFTAERFSHPIMLTFQAQMARSDPAGFGQRLKGRYQTAQSQIEQILSALIRIDNADSLGLYAQGRNRYFQASLEAALGRAQQKSQQAAERLTRAGDPIDEQKIFADELETVIAAARAQEKALYDRLPQGISSDAANLIDTFQKVLLDTQVGTQSIRLDTGKNAVGINKAIQDFIEITKRDNQGEDVSKLLDEYPGFASAFTAEDAPPGFEPGSVPIPTEVTSGQLLRLRQTIVEAIGRERGDTQLAQQLGRLDKAIQNDLRALDTELLKEAGTSQTGNVGRDLDNALAFSQAINNTFNNTIIGTFRKRNYQPEVILSKLLNNPIEGTVAMREVDNMVNFLRESLLEGTLPSPVRKQILDGDFTIPADARPEDRKLLQELAETGQRVQTIDGISDSVIRGLASRFINADGRVNEGAISRYLARPENREFLNSVSPTLLADLQDAQKAGRLLRGIKGRQDRGAKLVKQAQIMRYLTKQGIPILDNPQIVIGEVLGNPGERPPNPILNLRRLSQQFRLATPEKLQRAGLNITPEQLQNAFVDSVITSAFTRFGGEDPSQVFDFARALKQLNEPILPGSTERGTRLPSVLDILQDEGLIDSARREVTTAVLEQGARIQQIAKGDGVLTEEALQLLEQTPIFTDLVFRVVGSKLGVGLGSMIPGAAGSDLIAAGAGSAALRNLLDNTPFAAIEKLMQEVLTDPATASKILQLGMDRAQRGQTALIEGADLPLAQGAYRVLRNLLLETGLTDDLPLFSDAVREAGAAGRTYFQPFLAPDEGAVRRRRLREQAEPLAMTQRAQQLSPQAPLVSQGAPDPAFRQRFAAAYPQDIVSDVIRTQGIGSLLG